MTARGKTRFVSYAGQTVTGHLRTASTVDELRAHLAEAGREGWRVAIRAGRMAFDTQALSEGMVVQLTGFDAIGPVEDGAITVGANAAWGDILEATRKVGYVPYVMITTDMATAGGTMSSDCLSRFSPTCGKEGNHVLRFSLMTLDGRVLECSRTEHADLFRGVISGFGALGVVLDVTYRLMRVGFTNVVVETEFTPFVGLRDLAHALVTTVGQVRGTRDEGCPTSLDALKNVSADDARAVSCVVTLDGERRGFVMRSRYIDGDRNPLVPSPFHQPDSLAQRALQVLAMMRGPRHIGFWLTLHVFLARRTVSVDALRGFTFFEGGNDAVRRAMRSIGLPAGIRQQTFVLPLVPGEADATKQRLAAFLLEAERIVVEGQCDPTLVDVLYIPDDASEGFVLSSNHGLAGYAVTLTFEKIWSAEFPREDEVLRKIAQLCDEMGGRVHLVKNVFVPDGLTARAYAWGLEQLRALKRTYDPDHRLGSSFFARVLPELSR